MLSQGVELPETASQAEVEDAVGELGRRSRRCTASSCQLPLPAGLDPEPVLAMVPPEKDVDGLTESSMGRLVRGQPGPRRRARRSA